MLVVVVVLAVVTAALLVAVLITRSKLTAERERVAAAAAAASEQEEELTATREALTKAREDLAAETSAHAADSEHLEQLRVDLERAEQLATEAEQRARDAAAAGVDPGVVWPLELLRSERTWRFSVSPGPHATSPLEETDSPLITALKIDVDAARNEIGAEIELGAELPPEPNPPTAMLALRVAQELIADVAPRSVSSTVRVFIDGDDLVVSIDAKDRDGEPVRPAPLPVESPLIDPIDNGVRLLGCAPLEEPDGDTTEGC